MLKTIMVISGKPGLYKLVKQGNRNLIVETVDAQKKRMPVFSSERVVSLGDISIYTDDDSEIKLSKVFDNIKAEFAGKTLDVSPKKASDQDVASLFEKALPTYDRDRVRINDMRKVFAWYNILTENGLTDFTEENDGEDKPE